MLCTGFFGRGALVYVCVDSANSEELSRRSWEEYATLLPTGLFGRAQEKSQERRSLFRSPSLLVWERNAQSITLRTWQKSEKDKPIDLIEIGMRSVISIQLATDPPIDAGKKVKIILTHPMGTKRSFLQFIRGVVIENTSESITISTQVDDEPALVEIPKSNVNFILEEK